MHESSRRNHSRKNWLSIGDSNKSAQSYCVRIMIYQITFKKVEQKESNWNTSNTGFKTHPL